MALVNRTREKADALADTIAGATGHRPRVYSDYGTLFANNAPDAVSLGLPPSANPEVARAALEAGCHVIAEKPIAANLDDAREMAPWGERYGRVLMIAENWRYYGGFQRAAALIEGGAIGRPVQAHWAHYSAIAQSPFFETAWRRNPQHPGGYLSDGGVHHAAAMRGILGEAATVQATATSIRPDLPPLDTLSALITWDSGVVSTYQASYALGGPEIPLTIVGTDGAVKASREWVELWRNDKQVERWDEPSQEKGMVEMYADFARAIRTGQASAIDGRAGDSRPAADCGHVASRRLRGSGRRGRGLIIVRPASRAIPARGRSPPAWRD